MTGNCDDSQYLDGKASFIEKRLKKITVSSSLLAYSVFCKIISGYYSHHIQGPRLNIWTEFVLLNN